MRIPSDADANPVLAGDLQNLRSVMTAEAERAPLPERFTAAEHGERPAYIIRDAETGRTSYVPLYAYAAVRETLADLFGPDAPDAPDVPVVFRHGVETINDAATGFIA